MISPYALTFNSNPWVWILSIILAAFFLKLLLSKPLAGASLLSPPLPPYLYSL